MEEDTAAAEEYQGAAGSRAAAEVSAEEEHLEDGDEHED